MYLLRGKAKLLGLHLIHDEDNHDGNAERQQDDTERPKSPSEVDVLQEELSNLGTGESGADGRRVVDTHDDQSVAESSGVSDDNVNDIDETEVANPVERVCSSIHLDAVTCSLHDHTDNNQENHGTEAPDSTPNVNDLGKSQVPDGT